MTIRKPLNREFLERLRTEKELTDIRQPVDIRHIATLVDQSDTALYFHDVIGYDMPVVSGIIRSSRRASLALGCGSFSEIEHKLQQGLDHPIPPRYVETAPSREPQYYSAIAEKFAGHQFQTVARALGKLHTDEKLWQDPRGRLCVRGSGFAAKPPAKPD